MQSKGKLSAFSLRSLVENFALIHAVKTEIHVCLTLEFVPLDEVHQYGIAAPDGTLEPDSAIMGT